MQALLGRIKKHGPQDPILTGHQTSGSDAAEDRVGMGWNSGHDQASHPLDLEWLRLLPDQDALKYLMSIMGRSAMGKVTVGVQGALLASMSGNDTALHTSAPTYVA